MYIKNCRPKQKRKIIKESIKIIFLIISFFILFSCSPKKDADWTILIYMAADNSLNNAALADIEEMMAAEFSDELNVIVQIDESEYSESKTAKRYKITPGNKKQISNLGEIDSGDPATLTQFANWGFNKYSSDKKALIIWSHGNGWYNLYNKFCPDSESSSSISVPDGELSAAIEQINSKIDILILDACNMLAMEVIKEVYEFADFIIGSEAIICTDGFPYDETLSLFEDHVDTEALVQDMTITFVNSYMPAGSQNPYNDPFEISLAAVETINFPNLVSTLVDFVNTWQDSSGTEVFHQGRDECLIYFNDIEDTDIDIMDYFTKLENNSTNETLSADCEAMLEQIEQVFISHFYIDLDDPNGTQNYPAGTASIWFPQSQVTFDNLYSEYEKLQFANTGWLQFLQNTFAN
jgi:Clostripain family